MRILLEQLRRQLAPLSVVFVLATTNQLLLLAEPQVLRLIVDRWVMRAAQIPWPVFFRGVGTLVAASVAIALLARVARNYQDYGANLIAQRVSMRMYAQSVAHSLLLPFNVFEDQRSGELLHKMQKARTDAQQGIAQIVRLYLGVLAMAVIAVYAFSVHVMLGIVYASLGVALGGLMLAFSVPVRRQQRVIAQDAASLAGSTTEAIRNIELVKSLGLQRQEAARLDAANERLLLLEQRKLRLVRTITFAEGTILNTARALLLMMMLWLLHSGDITTGEFLTFFLYTQWLFAPLVDLGAVVARYQETRATFDTLDEIMEIEPERVPDDAVRIGSLESIALESVTLEYPGAKRAALDGIDVLLRAGETVALAGPSGSGKSTLVKLLTGLYLPSSGRLSINGVDARALDIDAFRARIGLVTQETHLFAGTIRENLLLVSPESSDEECLEALRRAAAMPILERGGRGLDTRIGEGGVKLSGGERQRVAIARALLRKPELLIFDEATSNLDSISERAITATIRDISVSGAARITVIVAHRLSTIAHADRILVLSDGHIAESGTHPTLLASGGLYARMHAQQSS